MPGPRSARSASIWTMSTTRAASDLAAISPKPTVENTVTLKYNASRAGQWLGEAPEEARSQR